MRFTKANAAPPSPSRLFPNISSMPPWPPKTRISINIQGFHYGEFPGPSPATLSHYSLLTTHPHYKAAQLSPSSWSKTPCLPPTAPSAAQTSCGKSSRDLTLPESALLAGLPQAPSYYSPFGSHPELAKERKDYVLKQMLDNRMISADDYQASSIQDLKFSPPPTMRAPHFSLWVKDLLVTKYGLPTVEQEGLTVTTTLDLDLQDFAQNTVASETATLQREEVGNGAALVTLPKTGEILGN